jgi:DNA helicase-2/ATP-dependent DNA helicase PcrA
MSQFQSPRGVSAKFQPSNISPSEEQLAIQTATDRIILIDANAGAAKTTSLSLRIAESLKRGLKPEDFIVLTVTEAAKSTFHARLIALGVPRTQVARLQVTTFEALALATLDKLEYASVSYLTDKEDLRPTALAALEEVCERYGDRYDIDASTTNLALDTFFKMQLRLKATLAIRQFQISLEEHTPDDIEALLGVPFTTYVWHLHYEKLRGAQNGEPLFRGLQDGAYDLVSALEDDISTHERLPACKVVVCDELHDLSEVTFRLLVALINRNNAFFFGAGDKDQVIFSWSGAQHDILATRFQQAFKTTRVYPLTRCYRHGPSLAISVGAFKNKKNDSGVNWDTGIDVLYYDKADASGCARKTLQAIKTWTAARGEQESIAILLRHPGQSVNLEAALINAGLQYQTEGLPSFLQRLEILMFRGMLAASLRNMETIQYKKSREAIFDALALFAEIPIDGDLRTHWHSLREEAISQPNAMEWFLTGTVLRLATHARGPVEACMNYLRGLKPDTPAGEVLECIASTMQLDQVIRRLYVDREDAASVRHSINEFIALAHASGMDIFAFSHWLGSTELQLSQRRTSARITIACADDIKGKEYDFVLIPYLEHHVFPRSTYDELERRDESNRFYVAITRARRNLVLLTPATESERSQYIYDMSIEQARQEGRSVLRQQ